MTLAAISTVVLAEHAVEGAIALYVERETVIAGVVAAVKTETRPERIAELAIEAAVRVLSGEKPADVAISIAGAELAKPFADGIDKAASAVESLEHIETEPLGPGAHLVDELPPDSGPPVGPDSGPITEPRS